MVNVPHRHLMLCGVVLWGFVQVPITIVERCATSQFSLLNIHEQYCLSWGMWLAAAMQSQSVPSFQEPRSRLLMNLQTLSKFYWSFIWKTLLGASPKPHLIFHLRSENTRIKPRRSTYTCKPPLVNCRFTLVNHYERPLAEDSNFFHSFL